VLQPSSAFSTAWWQCHYRECIDFLRWFCLQGLFLVTTSFLKQLYLVFYVFLVHIFTSSLPILATHVFLGFETLAFCKSLGHSVYLQFRGMLIYAFRAAILLNIWFWKNTSIYRPFGLQCLWIETWEPGSFVRGNGCCWKPVVLFSNTPCSLLEEFLF